MRDLRLWLGAAVLGLAFAAVSAKLPAEARTKSGVQPTGEASTGPVIADFGPVFEVASPDFETDLERDYRAVFDVARSRGEEGELNPLIVTVARFLNMHARAGVPEDRLEAALVLHGSAGKDALSNRAFQKRFGRDNPNARLLRKLHESGVKIVLCGQTAASRGFEGDELAEPVELALSAMTALVSLQADGFRLIAF